jgi:hypothetical protein
MRQPTASQRRPVKLAGAPLDRERHVCAFFNAREEEYSLLLPFISEGLAVGDKAFHIVDPAGRESHLRALEAAGIDVAAAVDGGQLEVATWWQAYLRDNRFDQEAMLEMIERVLNRAHAEGYPLTRLVAQMEWALEDLPGIHDIVEYEARLNHVLPNYDDGVICTYDATKFGGDVIIDIMRTHPIVIVGGLLRENPFFVPPDALLAELRLPPAGARAAHGRGRR